jgi:ariadne-1
MNHPIFIQMPNVSIRLMLSKYKWDVQVFLERFFEEPMDMDLVAQRMNPQKIVRRTRKCRRIFKICEICFEEIEVSEILELSCGHNFCTSCWKENLHHTINSGSLQNITCPGYNCVRLIDDDLVLPYITSDDHRSRFTQIITDSFVQFNRLIKWCGAAACTMAIIVEKVKNVSVKCHCSNEFCFECKDSVHILITCEMLREFNDLRGHCLNSAQWISKNSKPCPRCNVNIEKNGGCNYMSCGSCKLGFCWMCLNPISHDQHGNHPNCVTPEAARFKASRMRQLVDCNAKFNHQNDSIKLDLLMYKTNVSQVDLQKSDQWMKVNFIHDAINVLLHSRHTLKDSFIFQLLKVDADKSGTKMKLFEMNQDKLKQTTEKLSQLLETQVNGENYHEMKLTVQNLTKICNKMANSLTQTVLDGYENDWWKPNDEPEIGNQPVLPLVLRPVIPLIYFNN